MCHILFLQPITSKCTLKSKNTPFPLNSSFGISPFQLIPIYNNVIKCLHLICLPDVSLEGETESRTTELMVGKSITQSLILLGVGLRVLL